MRPSFTRAYLVRASVLFLIVLAATLFIGGAWAQDLGEPRVALLGSDRGLSILVTSGSARVLIVSGTDPAEFGNALTQARHPGFSRLDVLILSTDPGNARLAAHAAQLLDATYLMTIGDGDNLLESGVRVDESVVRPRLLELPGGLIISIEVLPDKTQTDSADLRWSMEIRKDSTTLLVVSQPDVVDELRPSNRPAALIYARGKPESETSLPPVGLVAVSAESIDGPTLRQEVSLALGPSIQTLRVHAGEAVRIDFTDSGTGSVEGSLPAGADATAVP